MAGGGHHEPSVLTHFLPGMVSGIVLGGITGTLIMTNIASASLQSFWEASRIKEYFVVEPCADASGVSISSALSDNGSVLTSVAIGGAEETLLTVAHENLRFVPVSTDTHAYLTAVASANQREAFPALSLYRIDYCAQKTLTHVLGSIEEPANILGMSDSGTWILYEKKGLLLMNTQMHEVRALRAMGEVVDMEFSQGDDGGAVLFGDGSGAVWSLDGQGALQEEAFVTTVGISAWILQSPEEYLANLQ